MRLVENSPVFCEYLNTYRIATAERRHDLFIEVNKGIAVWWPCIRIVSQPQSQHCPDTKRRDRDLERDANSSLSNEKPRQEFEAAIRSGVLLHPYATQPISPENRPMFRAYRSILFWRRGGQFPLRNSGISFSRKNPIQSIIFSC